MNEVLNCLETRRSCRAYRPEQVPEEALQEILRAGLYAPSGMGRQSVKLLVVQDPAAIAALERLNGGVLGSPEAEEAFIRTLIVYSTARRRSASCWRMPPRSRPWRTARSRSAT